MSSTKIESSFEHSAPVKICKLNGEPVIEQHESPFKGKAVKSISSSSFKMPKSGPGLSCKKDK
jgi:hypothetical protein